MEVKDNFTAFFALEAVPPEVFLEEGILKICSKFTREHSYQSVISIKLLCNSFSCFRSSPPEVFLRRDILEICSKFTGEDPCRSVISIKLVCNFIDFTLRHGCSPVNLMHIFRTPFCKSTSGGLYLLLYLQDVLLKQNIHLTTMSTVPQIQNKRTSTINIDHRRSDMKQHESNITLKFRNMISLQSTMQCLTLSPEFSFATR